MTRRLVLQAVPDIGEVEEGFDLGEIIGRALEKLADLAGSESAVVIAQKVVSKAEGRLVFLDEVKPSARALELAAVTGKSPPLVEMVLQESTEVLRAKPNILIVRHRLGYVVANAGIDQSNVRDFDGRPACLLLPRDPGASAARIRNSLRAWLQPLPAVIVSDSFGRPWRRGVLNVALGSAGLPALVNRRGHPDRYGRPLQVTEVALADALAAAAGIVMGEADEGIPAVLITGGDWSAPNVDAQALIRPLDEGLL